jgi:hypothetical protein
LAVVSIATERQQVSFTRNQQLSHLNQPSITSASITLLLSVLLIDRFQLSLFIYLSALEFIFSSAT